MPFKNMGTYNAGVVGGAMTVPGGAGGIMTMDAAGIASGNAFLVSEIGRAHV